MFDAFTLARLRRIGLTDDILQRMLHANPHRDTDTGTDTSTHTGTATHNQTNPQAADARGAAAANTPGEASTALPDQHAPQAQRSATHAHPDLNLATWWRIAEVQRQHLRLHGGEATVTARALPSVLSALATRADALAVGDWVLAAPDAHGQWWVHQRLPPRNQIARRVLQGQDGLAGHDHVARTVIVSNVDTALLVMGLDGDFNLRRLQRYSALVQLAQVRAVVVLTKADLCPELDQRLAQVREQLPADLPVVAVAGHQPEAAQALSAWTSEGQTLVLLGASGAGKSTLTNTLCGQTLQTVGGTRARDGRGRHTTTVRSLHRMASGACVIDTPGLRTLRLDTDEAALTDVFSDVADLAPQCRFRNCQHQAEPGCAVREALPAERVSTFHKLSREARRDQLTALERQQQRAQWKARGRAGGDRAKAKRAM